MKTTAKSKGIPLDEIRLEQLKDPKRARFAMKLALKELMWTSCLIPCGWLRRLKAVSLIWHAKRRSVGRHSTRRSLPMATRVCGHFKACSTALESA